MQTNAHSFQRNVLHRQKSLLESRTCVYDSYVFLAFHFAKTVRQNLNMVIFSPASVSDVTVGVLPDSKERASAVIEVFAGITSSCVTHFEKKMLS